jgi:hypothetical protein
MRRYRNKSPMMQPGPAPTKKKIALNHHGKRACKTTRFDYEAGRFIGKKADTGST